MAARNSYRSNRNVVYSCKYHVVWCPKYRRGVLRGAVENDLKAILYATTHEHRVDLIELETMPDHVHMLVEVDPQFGIHRLVRLLKGRSSFLLRQKYPYLRRQRTLWTNSYFVSTVGGAPLEVVKQCVANQKVAA
jgi:putative transposase